MSAPAATLETGTAGPADAGERRTVAVVSLAHGCSHFFHLVVPPLFPWLKVEFGLSWAELGLLMTVFFAVSGVGQALAGFVVDRIGAVPVMLASLACFVVAALAIATAPGHAALVAGCALAGLGNSPFHPVDYSILNARVPAPRLARAYAVHAIAGNLGWALAPVFMVGITGAAGWRVAAAAAALLAAAVLATAWAHRERLAGVPVGRLGIVRAASASASGGGPRGADSTFAFLRLPAVWMSFAFFFTMAVAFGGLQTFGPEAARVLHGVDAQWVAACLTVYMLASAAGTVLGGWTAGDPAKAERVVATGFGAASLFSLAIALTDAPGWMVPILFGAMGFGAGTAGPARDLLVRRASPPGATGRVYGLVYSGLDAGMALAPAGFGRLMDHGMPSTVWLVIAGFQALLIGSALSVGRIGRARAAVAA
ncbi:MAG TPA: MFS transporter [Burkholderiaceae bacterium]|nr:MFS transporter [Burkholderiaceae bacterium]